MEFILDHNITLKATAALQLVLENECPLIHSFVMIRFFTNCNTMHKHLNLQQNIVALSTGGPAV